MRVADGVRLGCWNETHRDGPGREGWERGDLTGSENSECGPWETATGKELAAQAGGPEFNPQGPT